MSFQFAQLRSLPRRWYYFIVLAAISVLLLFQGYNYQSAKTQPPAGSLPYIPSFEVNNDGNFRWTDRSRNPHFPVPLLTRLPEGKAKTFPKIQAGLTAESATQKSLRLSRRQRVKETFVRGWSSYRDRAWMKDEVGPISGRPINVFGGWAATLVDALDTLWIMDLKDDFAKTAEAATRIDFTTSSDEIINVFETTIRYLGGLLSAYDLSGHQNLLNKATEVGEMLLVPFDTPNHLPITRWLWRAGAQGLIQETPKFQLLSEPASLSLEFTRLSQLTGDMRWYDAIDRISKWLYSQQTETALPGMWPVSIFPNIELAKNDTFFTLGGMSDSTYEYLPKQHMLLGGQSSMYQEMYERAATVAQEAILIRPMTPNKSDILIPGDAITEEGKPYVQSNRGQHLGCFAGGMYALAGRIFSRPEHVEIGRKITEGCVWAYKAMPHGVMPEIATFVPCASKTECEWDRTKWLATVAGSASKQDQGKDAETIIKLRNLPEGFASIPDTRYILRPEAIESVFIMYRITGEEKWREMAWEMFDAIENVSRTNLANAAIADISAVGIPPKDDRMESFWFAETLKYFYLIFSEPDLIDLDVYVLNTEAHPLKRPV